MPEYGTGRYRAKIDVMKQLKSQEEKLFFITEAIVQESNVEELPKGSRCTYMMDLGKVVAPGNVKSLLCAVNGLDPNGEDDAVAIENENWDTNYETAISEDNPTRGLEFIVECFYRRKKGAGKVKPNDPPTDKALDNDYYTHNVFYPVPEEAEKAAE